MVQNFRNFKFLAATCVLFGAQALTADTVETIPFLAQMSATQEVGSTASGNSGDAQIWVHVIRDDAGKIKSGSVDFNIRYRFPGATTITGLHIHNGPAGVNASIVIPTDVSATNSVTVDQTGRGTIFKQVNFPTGTTLTAALIQDLLANPQNYYVNMHTTIDPGGAMRSQLFPAQMKVLMGLMSPANENPPITGTNASGVPSVIALRAFDSTGKVMSGWSRSC